MIYFDSDMSKSTNTVVYFDWKTIIYIYVCGKGSTQFMLPMEKSVTFTGACANDIIPSINRSFVYKAKERRHVRLLINIYYFTAAVTFTTTVQDTTSNDTTGRPLIYNYKCPCIVPLYYNINNHSVCLSKNQAYHMLGFVD
jgi:hypothetical protein